MIVSTNGLVFNPTRMPFQIGPISYPASCAQRDNVTAIGLTVALSGYFLALLLFGVAMNLFCGDLTEYSHADPVSRNVGVQLTNVIRVLHRMDPLIQSQLTRQYDSADQGASAPLPSETLRQYLALTGRMGNLVRDLYQWRNT